MISEKPIERTEESEETELFLTRIVINADLLKWVISERVEVR